MDPKKAAKWVPKAHPHHETGITDEAAVEGHDLIHNAEEEEEKVSLFSTRQTATCSKLSNCPDACR